MALTDPQTITVNSVAKVMPRIDGGANGRSLYRLADLSYSLEIRHRNVTRDKKRRVVSTVAFQHRKVVADPLTAVNDYETLTESAQFDRPEIGFTNTEISDDWTGFKTWCDSTMLGKLIGGES
jgi:hypothetical protein